MVVVRLLRGALWCGVVRCGALWCGCGEVVVFEVVWSSVV